MNGLSARSSAAPVGDSGGMILPKSTGIRAGTRRRQAGWWQNCELGDSETLTSMLPCSPHRTHASEAMVQIEIIAVDTAAASEVFQICDSRALLSTTESSSTVWVIGSRRCALTSVEIDL